MTIICYKDGKMAADGISSFGGSQIYHTEVTKITTTEPGEKMWIVGKRVLGFGMAGSAGLTEVLRDLLRKGLFHDTKPYHSSGSVLALVVTEGFDLYFVNVNTDGITILHCGGESDENVKPYDAIGTSTLVAKVYMSVGKSALDTVKYLVKTNHVIGGKIREVDFFQFAEELKEKEKALPKGFVFKPTSIQVTPKPKPANIQPTETTKEGTK